MTTPSKPESTQAKKIEQLVSNALDASIDEQLSESVQRDIAAARTRALNIAKQQPRSVNHRYLVNKLKPLLSFNVLVPSAVAVCAVMLVNYMQVISPSSSFDLAQYPPLPIEVLDESIPDEDLALLQDIEFAHWLATQESELQEATL